MEKEEEKFVRWFSEITKKDIKIVGGKGANLGEMYRAGFPVPPGFVVTADAYEYFLRESGLKDKIYSLLNSLDPEDTTKLEDISKKIQEMIEKAKMPEEIEKEIIEAYEILSYNNTTSANEIVSYILKTSREDAFVAVRSSATAEDTSSASFAGQQETFLNVKGKENLIEHIKKVFASLFTPRSIYYRIKKGFKHENVLIAVVVQLMINADKSGVIFSHNPIDKSENIVIEAVFGLGEGIVSGKIKPDFYLVSRDLDILEEKIADKKIAITRDSNGKTIVVNLTKEKSKRRVLTAEEIKKLASYAIKLEKHYNLPQDIEFAIDSGEIYIVQTRPITTLSLDTKKEKIGEGKILVKGLGASPGIGVGEVKIIKKLEDLTKIRKGDILVTKMTSPDMVVEMQKCSAIVTDEGGMTCHAAIVSREMGIPAVVGTENATSVLKEGMIVTVDAFDGVVYEGKIKEEEKVEIKPIVETKTKIKVGIDLPSFVERAEKTGCKEIGLLRIEGIIAESGKHPLFFLNNEEEYKKIIFDGISQISKNFEKVWIRTSDIRSDEYSSLKGAPKEKEQNPMLGLHGIRASLKYPSLLKAELGAMLELAQEKKVGVMIPQLVSLEELKKFKEILKEFDGDKKLEIGVMIETPAAVQIIEDLCKEGISFISFGTNDLTQYTLAVDRNNKDVQYLYDEMNPAILKQLSYVISVCKKYNVETSICGQAANRKEMVEFLIKEGIDSLTLNPDKAHEISTFIKELEEKQIEEKILITSEENQTYKEWPDIELGIDIFSP